MADDEQFPRTQGNEVLEYRVFLDHYDVLVTTFANTNLYRHFVAQSIITISDNHKICCKTDPQEKAEILLRIIGVALEIGYSKSFYKMLGIMRDYGNEFVKALANKISQSSGLKGSDFANTSVSTSSSYDATSSPHAIPSEVVPLPDCFDTSLEANDKFCVVLSHITEELNVYIRNPQNDEKFKSVCYYLTQKVLVLSQEDKKQIENSKSFTDIKDVMEPHWNWSSHRLLYIIIEKLKSSESLKMLQKFDEKINKQMKLKLIHENLRSKATRSSGYCKMIAILNRKKDYSEITLEEGLVVEEFVFDYLGRTGAHSSKAYKATEGTPYAFMEMEWNVSIAAVDSLCTKATKRKDAFIKESFLFLKIGSFTVINELPIEAGKPHVPRASLMMVFNDPIHGHIELDPVLLKIIDTPQFQRLRYIKQLGGGYFVFPGASHNRFEHSIGTCYLAGELAETLKTKQPELGITNDDVLCVKMAGLCNNLGCGPFSYMFEKSFIPKVRPDCTKWKHQITSVKMFDYLVKENKLTNEFKENDLEFVRDLILCPPKNKNWAATGRSEDKEFLYEIVTNKRNGIDVNKWDYFARDCYHLGITSIFDYRRFMMFARVIECDGRRQICTRDKEVMNLYDMFYTRYLLHKRAYHHKTVNAVELMICEAFLKANDHIILKGKNVKLSDCIDNMPAYTHLTDHVFHQILLSTGAKLKESREILNKVLTRHLYKYIGRTQPKSKTEYTEEEIVEQIIKCTEGDMTTDDLVVKIVTFDYGMEEKNPIDHVRFYAKDHPNHAFKLKKERVSRVMLLKEFVEQEIRVYCKKRDENSLQAARELFRKWCSKTGYTTSPDSEFDDDTYTPYVTPSKCSQDPDDSDLKAAESKKRKLDFDQ